LEFEGPQWVMDSLDEKEKMIQILKKKLKMPSTDHPHKIDITSLD
jgi:hypothetical protein